MTGFAKTWHNDARTEIQLNMKATPQCTCQAKTVVGRSLTPCTALLVLPSGTVHPVVDHHEFIGSENAACESRPDYP